VRLLLILVPLLAAAKSYPVEGLVLAIDRAAQTLTVSHKEIPGVMPAMAMPIAAANPKELANLRPGMRVRLRLDNGTARQIRVIPVDNAIEEAGRRVALEAPKETVPIGQPMPDWTLTNQQNKPIRIADLKGKLVVVQFLYTRCPMPEVCPRLAATFASIQRRFASEIGRELVLLSITLDPKFDTPSVLDAYAKLWRAAPPNWHMLTGSEEAIRHVAALFGIVYWPEEGVITHTSTIALIGRDGVLTARVEGLSFDARQLSDLIHQNLTKILR
jgi:protein SCO1/2